MIELTREQCTDIVKFTASNDCLDMDMDDLKRFYEEVMGLIFIPNDEYSCER